MNNKPSSKPLLFYLIGMWLAGIVIAIIVALSKMDYDLKMNFFIAFGLILVAATLMVWAEIKAR
jgi:hypothetical protein